MEKAFLSIIFLLTAYSLSFAQAPQGIPYQAVARNSSGAILASQPLRVRFTIRDSVATGTVVYQETFNPTTTALGLFNVNVGTGSVVTGTFSNINWGHNAKFMQVEMDPTGGTSFVDMGTQQMMSVPYALNSRNGLPSGSIVGDILYWNGSNWLPISHGIDGQLLTLSGGIPTWMNSATLFSPIVTTDGVTSVTSFTATCGGNVISAGSSSVTARGVCWGVSPGPTVTLATKTIDGAGLGTFSSNITGLSANTTYYVRAYATNGVGTTYGSEYSFTTSPLSLGLTYQGGVIFYILRPGDIGYDPLITHGLIAAPSDQIGGTSWGCQGTTIAGTSRAIGTGKSNTSLIVGICTPPFIAAQICKNLILNGYSDWYLPSDGELYQLYLNRSLVGSFPAGWYWSSSNYELDYSYIYAYAMNIGSGVQFVQAKSFNLIGVRAIRSF